MTRWGIDVVWGRRLTVVMAIVHCACGDPSGPEDGSTDAAVDAVMDSGESDADRADANDAATSDWIRLPGLPVECPIERAVNPEGVGSFVWAPCAGAVGYTVLSGAHRALGHLGTLGMDGAYFWILDPVDDREMLHIVARTNGPPVAVFRAPNNSAPGADVCSLGSMAMSPDEVVFKARAPEWIGTEHVFSMPFATPDAIRPVDVLDAATLGTSTIGEMAGSTELVAFDLQPGSRMFVVSEPPRMEVSRAGGAPFQPWLVGDHLLWSELSDRVRLVHRASDGASEVYVQSDMGDVIDVLVDASHVTFVLAIPTYATTGPFELWAGTYARNAADFVPRRVVVLPHGIRPVLGGGHVAYADRSREPATIAVVDLASGVTRRYTPPGEYSVAPMPLLAVSAAQVLFRVTDGSGNETVMMLELNAAPFEEVPATP